MHLDSVQIGAADVGEGVRAYSVLLGVEPVARPGGRWRFQLAPGAVEIDAGPPGLHSLRFHAADHPPMPPTFHGITVRVDAHTPDAGAPHPEPTAVAGIDHVVVRTAHPERAIALWRDTLGLRLALDREFPARNLRLLFFRTAGMTLEYACPLPPPAELGEDDAFYGVSYRVTHLAAIRARLLAAGLDVSEVRTGMKPGSSVASVRSGTGGVPTLLIEQPGR